MKKNMGILDRTARVVIAAIIVILALLSVISGTLAVVLLIVAGVLILTSLVGFCPMYKLLGISSCRPAQSATEQAK